MPIGGGDVDRPEAVGGGTANGGAFEGEDVGSSGDGEGLGLMPVPVKRWGDGVDPVGGFVVAEGGIHAFDFVDDLGGGWAAPVDGTGAVVESEGLEVGGAG